MSMGERIWQLTLQNDAGRRRTELCKAQDIYMPWYQHWCAEMGEQVKFHRKQWEYAYNMQALWERGCIATGMRGLVFAAGTEPAPSIFAKYGCTIMATDILPEKGKEKGWDNDAQLCYGIQSLNTRKLCDDDIFKQKVSYRPVDMTAIPDDLKDFDFNWSSCAFEHLGSIEKGLTFLKEQLKTLKPGGWAIHTTEFNISSNTETQDNNETVVFRQKDIEQVIQELKNLGHFVEEADFSIGGMPEDYMVDVIPHEQKIHLKLQIDRFVVTSIGIIIQKKG